MKTIDRDREQKIKDYRTTVCVGCRYNRYNFKSDGERPGIDAPTSGDGCWYLDVVTARGCRMKS